MVNGASLIAGPIPGRFLDPLGIAKANKGDVSGYVIIAYGDTAGTYDVIFLQGKDSMVAARIESRYRFLLPLKNVEERVVSHERTSDLSIYLYDAPETIVDRFLATFESHASIRLPSKMVSLRSSMNSLATAEWGESIMEIADFEAIPPAIDLYEIGRDQPFPEFGKKRRNSQLTVYDLTISRELQKQLQELGLMGQAVSRLLASPSTTGKSVTSCSDVVDTAAPTKSGEDARRLNSMIRDILSASSSGDTDPGETEPGKITIATRESENRKPRRRKNVRSSDTSALPARTAEAEAAYPPPADKLTDSVRAAQIAALFRRLYQDFHQQASPLVSNRLRQLVEKAEQNCQVLHPRFRVASFADDNAFLVLDVIEYIVKHGPIFRRARLRLIAQTLIAVFYAGNSQFLEKASLLSKVEESYYRLK